MKTFTFKIRFISDYLQARFSEQAKAELTETVRQTILQSGINADPDEWAKFLYVDEQGCYIPGEQIEQALYNSGRDFKVKAKRTNFSGLLKATVFAAQDKFYLNKQAPDNVLTSYPKRKDGSRVVTSHPVFNAGTEVSLALRCSDDGIDEKTLKQIIVNAGLKYGLGARRPKFGRFEVVDFNVI